jgi:hypothetical protein
MFTFWGKGVPIWVTLLTLIVSPLIVWGLHSIWHALFH